MVQDIGAAVRATKGGVALDIEVQPGSKNPGKLSYDGWRKRLRLSVGERAQKGKANEDVISTLAEILGVKETEIEIISGHTDRRKSVIVGGLELKAVLERLAGAMEAVK